jgi:hypothetical protein
MRLVEFSNENGIILLDRSPDGIKRYVIEDQSSTRVFNSLWYTLDQVKDILNVKDGN